MGCSMEKVIEIVGVSKSYGVTKALDNVSMNLYRGEIHGLLGTNGSGKSTLLNILFGNKVIEESGGYSGEILLRDRKIDPFNNNYKGEFGMIHQEFILIDGMTIWENINLGQELTNTTTKKYLGDELAHISVGENKKETINILKELDIDIDVDLRVGEVSTSIKQFIEIAREIKKKDLKILFLDEPTAALNKVDSDILLKILKVLARRGLTIVFISHRLDEVTNLCDRVSIIRDGRLISKYEKNEFDIKTIEKDMTGYDIEQSTIKKRRLEGKKILELTNFGVDMSGDESRGINLDIIDGEIVGITSLSGHGKLSIGYGLGGLIDTTGDTKYCGEIIDTNNISENIKRGLVVLTEDRKNLNLLMDQSVEENIVFTNTLISNSFLRKGILGKMGFIDTKKVADYSKKCVADYDIKVSSTRQKLRELSGGNQQKVCVARAISLEPKLLFVGEPTRGIDVAAKEKVLKSLVDINRNSNTTIIISSSEVEELERICDRIVVLNNGKVSHIIGNEQTKVERAGVKYA